MDPTPAVIATFVAFTLPLIALWIAVFYHLVRRKDLRRRRKVAWAIAIVVLSYVGIAAYAISIPAPVPKGKATDLTIPESSQKVSQLEHLVAAHRAGTINDDDFEHQKRAILQV
ncbi:MAG: PLDc N-terminal domain-containing protein [Acidimicrobiia bacterium]|nr:PLDc N-terminal domain-containing protein [Acidimicrobiia bacterium]